MPRQDPDERDPDQRLDRAGVAVDQPVEQVPDRRADVGGRDEQVEHVGQEDRQGQQDRRQVHARAVPWRPPRAPRGWPEDGRFGGCGAGPGRTSRGRSARSRPTVSVRVLEGRSGPDRAGYNPAMTDRPIKVLIAKPGPRRPRPRRQGPRPRPARRGLRGRLHGPAPDARDGRDRGAPGGRRRRRPVDPVGRAHDARAADHASCSRTQGMDDVLVVGRRDHPRRRRAGAQGGRRGRDLRAGDDDRARSPSTSGRTPDRATDVVARGRAAPARGREPRRRRARRRSAGPRPAPDRGREPDARRGGRPAAPLSDGGPGPPRRDHRGRRAPASRRSSRR